MENQNNAPILTRDEAWWFIPEEYCPIFRELERKFNKHVTIPKEILDLEQKIKEIKDALKELRKQQDEKLHAKKDKERKALESILTEKKGKLKQFSQEGIEAIVEPLRKERCYHYDDLANNKNDDDSPTAKKLARYSTIMEKEVSTKEIVGHFIKYFRNLGILKETNKGEYYFEDYSTAIANYKVSFVSARIILECITYDLQSNRASRMMIFEAMHSLNQNPLVDIIIEDNKVNRERALYDVYRINLRNGLEILRSNGLVTESNDCDHNYEFVYRQEDITQQEFDHEIRRKCNNERKVAALRALDEIQARFHQTTNTSREKGKAKLKRAQPEIDEKLSQIDQSSENGRITYHWYNVILQSRNYLDSRKFRTFADDVITYIRYRNIKNAITPVDKDSLYEWEDLFQSKSDICKLIQKEANLRIKSWPISISDADYQKAVNNILNVINNLIGNDIIEPVPLKNDTNENTIEQKRVRNEQLLSLLFVRAHIEPESRNELSSHLDQLFTIITSNEDKNHFDLCIIIRWLDSLARNNTFTYISKTKSWIYALKNISEGSESFIVQTTLIKIYMALIVLSSDDASREKYQRACRSLFSELKPQNYNQKGELIWLQLQYLTGSVFSKGSISYQEIGQLLSDLWRNIGALLALADKNDPRAYIFKHDTLELAIRILKNYFDFGYSTSILLSNAYLELIGLNINDSSTNYKVLGQLGDLIKEINREMAVRIAITNESAGFANWFDYNSIAIGLLELNDYNRALEYICKAEESYNKCNLGDIQGQTLYLESLLIKAEILFLLGKESEAKSLCSNCEKKLKELDELYPQDLRPSVLQYTANRLNIIMSTLESLPYIYRCIRLLNVLMAIEKMESVTPEIEDFFNKWGSFNGVDLDKDESNSKELIEEFKSDLFPLTMEAVTKNVIFQSHVVDTTPITVEEIKKLLTELEELYRSEQRFFLRNNGDELCPPEPETKIELPSDNMLFELLQPQRSTEAFVHQMKMENNQTNYDKNLRFEDFEKYHYIAMSDWASTEDRINASNLFISKLDPSTKSVRKREMAAEVLCQQSCLVEYSDWDKKEKLLNQAKSYIENKDGSIISYKAKVIYIRILHCLCDVYDNQERSGLQESMVEDALELINSNNIRTVDAAYFLGKRAEHILNSQDDRKDAIALFERAIAILRDIKPPTDDSLHYLEFYEDILSRI